MPGFKILLTITVFAVKLSVLSSNAQGKISSESFKSNQISLTNSRDKAEKAVLCGNPDAWWSMDDWDNSSKMNLHLVPGKFGNALWLNGSNRLLGKGLGKFEQLSLSFWLKPGRIHPQGNTLLSSSNQPGSLNLRILSDTRLQLSVTGLGQVNSDTPFATRYGWHHVAIAVSPPLAQYVFMLMACCMEN